MVRMFGITDTSLLRPKRRRDAVDNRCNLSTVQSPRRRFICVEPPKTSAAQWNPAMIYRISPGHGRVAALGSRRRWSCRLPEIYIPRSYLAEQCLMSQLICIVARNSSEINRWFRFYAYNQSVQTVSGKRAPWTFGNNSRKHTSNWTAFTWTTKGSFAND